MTIIGNSIFSAEEEHEEEEREHLDPYNKRKRLWEQGCPPSYSVHPPPPHADVILKTLAWQY